MVTQNYPNQGSKEKLLDKRLFNRVKYASWETLVPDFQRRTFLKKNGRKQLGQNKKGGERFHLFCPKSYHELNLLMLW